MNWRIIIALASLSIPIGVGSKCICTQKILMLTMEDNQRVIFSPDFPRPYCPNLECIWRIMSTVNSSGIHFNAKNLDLRDVDFLHFHENEAGRHVFHKLSGQEFDRSTYNCSGKMKTCEYKTSASNLVIRFVSSAGVIDKYGFQGTVVLHDRQLQTIISSVSTWKLIGSIVVIIVLVLLAIALACTLFKWRQSRNKGAQIPTSVSASSMSKNGDKSRATKGALGGREPSAEPLMSARP